MKKILVILSLSLLLAVSLSCAQEKRIPDTAIGVNWIEDYDSALEQAKAENKTILINFTGSDWCKWCIKLSDEVFTKKEFVDYANENLIMLKIDFPTTFRQLPQEEQMKRQALQERYGVRGYPTILLVNFEGGVLGQTGYQPGGPQEYINHLKEIINKKEK